MSQGIQSATSARKLSVQIAGAGHVGGEAMKALEKMTTKFANDVINEASLQELRHRADSSVVPQYTSAHIEDAARIVKNPTKLATSKGRRTWRIVLKVTMYGLGIVVAISSRTLSEPVSASIFAGSLASVLFITAIVEVSDWKK